MTDAFMDIDIAEKLLVQTISMANFALQIETRRQLFQDVTFHLYTKCLKQGNGFSFGNFTNTISFQE